MPPSTRPSSSLGALRAHRGAKPEQRAEVRLGPTSGRRQKGAKDDWEGFLGEAEPISLPSVPSLSYSWTPASCAPQRLSAPLPSLSVPACLQHLSLPPSPILPPRSHLFLPDCPFHLCVSLLSVPPPPHVPVSDRATRWH